MAWCPYCRKYTVNGRCPNCNRMYTEPNKNYDFYGNEIKSTSSGSSGITYTSDPYFWGAFWLGVAINFGAIIIAKNKNRKMLKGAIIGTVVNSIFTLHVLTIFVYTFLYMFGYL